MRSTNPLRWLILLLAVLVLLLYPTAALGQAAEPHSVTLNWEDLLNPAGTTYKVYRATGLCSGTPSFTALANGVTAKTYIDLTVSPGNYCYQVTAVYNGIESAPSNSALAPVPSWAPTKLSVVVK
jgi:spermidine/putrescine-binding protein